MAARALLMPLWVVVLLTNALGSNHALATGNDPLWVQRFDGPEHGEEWVDAMAMSSDGARVFVTGQSYSGDTSNDIETVAYDASSGTELWEERLDPLGGRSEQPNGLAISPDGERVFVTGASSWSGTPDNVVTIAYDSVTGALLWMRVIPNLSVQSSGRALGVSPDGDLVFVAGVGNQPGGTANMRTVALDTADGTTLWNRVFDSPNDGSDIGTAFAVSPDRSRVIATSVAGKLTGEMDWIVLSYDASTGALQWRRRIPGRPVNQPLSVAMSSLGDRAFVTGWFRGIGVQAGATVALDAESGTILWEQFLTGLDRGSATLNDVTASLDGERVFVTGYAAGVGSNQTMITAAYEARTGRPIWKAHFAGPSGLGALGHGLVASPDGLSVFVVGPGYGEAGSDFATVKYAAATGTLIWSRHYDGPTHGDDTGLFIALSPDGSTVVVAGSSWGSDSDYDFATVAYRA